MKNAAILFPSKQSLSKDKGDADGGEPRPKGRGFLNLDNGQGPFKNIERPLAT